MALLAAAVVFATGIGYLAQVTGLCMVRGVSELNSGRPLRLLAMLMCGFWVYAYLPFMHYLNVPTPLDRYGFHWLFVGGGLLFGFGAALNGGCAVSTVSRFSTGDMRMFFTMIGWLLGWLGWAAIGIEPVSKSLAGSSQGARLVLMTGIVCINYIVLLRYRAHWRRWSGVMLVGVMGGALFVIQPRWSPSDFLRDVGISLLHQSSQELPTPDRILLLAAMLAGMTTAAWREKKVFIFLPHTHEVAKHSLGGILMGMGAALASGGNDAQLLIALPALSPAGFAAIVGILVGIDLGLRSVKAMNRPPFSKNARSAASMALACLPAIHLYCKIYS